LFFKIFFDPTFPDFQISRNLAWARLGPGWAGLGPGLGRAWAGPGLGLGEGRAPTWQEGVATEFLCVFRNLCGSM